MDKAEKRAVRLEISKILDFECGPCVNGVCKLCPVRQRLNKLGESLESKKFKDKRNTGIYLSHAEYVQMFKDGKTDEEIMTITGAKLRTVRGHRFKMGNKHEEYKKVMITKEEFADYFERGLSVKEVMDLRGCSHNCYYENKRKWIEEKKKEGMK